MHERDILVPMHHEVAHTALDLQLAVLYGLLSAATPAASRRDHVDDAVVLDGSPSGCYTISHTADDVTVTASPTAPASLRAPVIPLLESLAGRGPTPGALLGPSETVTKLSALRALAT